jgi:hypothetical protein
MFARHRNARGMDDVSLNAAASQPGREPKTIASGLIGYNDAHYRMPGLLSLPAPAA